MHPFVSVIIPTYNRALTIMNSMESVLNQTFQDFEIIVVDDGSEDETEKVLMKFHQHIKVKYYKMEHGGVSKARNYGADRAEGSYLVFLDSDDQVDKEWLKTFNDLSKGDKDIVFCGARFVYENGREKIKQPKSLGFLFDNITGIFNAGTYCVRKQLFALSGGFDQQLTFGENYDLGVRIVANMKSYNFSEKPLLVYNKISKRDSSSLQSRINSKVEKLEKYGKASYLTKKKIKEFKFETFQSIAVDHAQAGEVKVARTFLSKAISLKPYHPLPYLRLLLVLINFYR